MGTHRSPLHSSSQQPVQLARVLTGLAQRTHTTSGGAAVAAVVQTVASHVDGARWASVSLLRPGQNCVLGIVGHEVLAAGVPVR